MIGRSLVALSILSAASVLAACGDSGTSSGGGDQGGNTPQGGEDQGGNNTGAGNTGGDGQGGDGPANCGNGTIDAGEDCDGSDLNGSDCVAEGFESGTLACAANCTYDTTDCAAAACGDGNINGTEDCDGTLLGGATCQTEGFDSGTLACAANCTFNTMGCADFSCGDGAINGAEECDGALLGTNTCQTEGFEGGTLVCTNCQLDAVGCVNENCADGIDNGGDTFIDCADTDCTASCASSCAAPIVLADPSVVSGTTDGHADVFDHSCSSGGGGEVTYTITPAVTGVLELTLTSNSDDMGVSVWTACGTGEIGCADATGGAVENLVVQVTMGVPVFVTVEAYVTGNTGPYTLDVASRAIVCGDTITDPTEECDDGNTMSGDGCESNCQLSCGNLVVDAGAGEECDDGNTTNGDGCENNCQFTCGNGIVNAGETCDDGNSVGSDGCNATCTAFECAFLNCADACSNNESCNSMQGCVAGTPPVQPHAKCVTGGPLVNTPGCTAGNQGVISQICAVDSFCCNNSWDNQCVSEVFSIGDSKVCAASQGTCSHTLCTTGAALVGNCDSGFGDCVDAICAVDSFCCNNSWDSLCVSRVASTCNLNCL